MKKYFIFIVFFGYTLSSFAQNETSNTEMKKEKIVDNYIGIQVNGLIKQVFNSSNSANPAATDPYLLTYSMNSRKTGWGFRVGVNGNFGSSSNTNVNSQNTTTTNDVRFRIGVDKAYKLSKKWTTGAGIDLLINNNNDETTSSGHNFYDTLASTIKTVFTSYGAGVMGWLRYNITERILLGTEASFYYTTGQETYTIDEITTGINQPAVMHVVSKPTISRATINLPVVFYLSVKF